MSAIAPYGLFKRPNGEASKTRRWVQISGLAPSHNLGVFNNNLENGYRAFAERYCMCKVGEVFEPALATEFDRFMEGGMLEFLQRVVDAVELAPVATTSEVVLSYTGPKRELYRKAEEVFWQKGLKHHDSDLHSFVKFEKTNLAKAPRVINPRSPMFNLGLAQYLKHNEKAYYKAIADVYGQDVVVFKGTTQQNINEWITDLWNSTAEAIGIGADAVKFDMHISVPALIYEHLFYILPYAGTLSAAMARYKIFMRYEGDYYDHWDDVSKLCWLLSRQLMSNGKAYFDDGKLKFKFPGKRASGDINTSLGNTLLMCAMNYAWMRRCGVSMKLVNNGDDCHHILAKKDEGRWRDGQIEFYESLGFRMALEPTVYDLEGVEFCQSKPLPAVGSMVRNPHTAIVKASMCLHPFTTVKEIRQWMTAVGMCEGVLAKGVPVLQEFAKALRRNGVRVTQRKARNLAGNHSHRFYGLQLDDFGVVKITDEARVEFAISWGIQPDEQIALEQYYSRWVFDRQLVLDIAAPSPVMVLLDPTI